MKSEDVKLSKKLNEHVWKHGIRNPPHHVKVTVSKDEKGVVNADLFGEEKVSKKSAPKAAKVEEKKAEVKEEAKPETKAESA